MILPVALTCGDPSGVGPELALAARAVLQADLPMFWIGGLMMYLMPALQAGATCVCPGKTLNNSRVAMGSVLTEADLARAYKSTVDPRLNYEQSLEIAMLIVRKRGGRKSV